MYITQNDLKKVKELKESLNDNSITYTIAEALLGEYAIPEYILEISEEIKTFPLNEENMNNSSNAEGTSMISASLGCDNKTAKSLVKNPKSAGICLRALRDKYEEVFFRSKRATAEEKGFFATILYTIKRAMYWIIKTFKDIKDDVFDLIEGRPENTTISRSDVAWLNKMQDNYLSKISN